MGVFYCLFYYKEGKLPWWIEVTRLSRKVTSSIPNIFDDSYISGEVKHGKVIPH